jgi:hypothetical protein
MKQLIKSFLMKAYSDLIAYRCFTVYRQQFKNMAKNLGIPDKPISGENEYKNKWSAFSRYVEPYSYRIFSRYMGLDKNIIPENIGHTYIESVLNPKRFRSYYADKNLFDITFREGSMPKTFIRRMNGGTFLNAGFLPISVLGGG